MKNSAARGFIFSLDAFVAFTLALVAIYTVIFFSSIPSAYYNSLAQAHYLSKDTLLALSQTKCNYGPCSDRTVSILEHLLFRSRDKANEVKFFIGSYIPVSLGYSFEVSGGGDTWDVVYSTAGDSDPSNLHNRKKQKLSVSSYTVAFDYSNELREAKSPYTYNTCDGGIVVCELPVPTYRPPGAVMKIVKLTVFI